MTVPCFSTSTSLLGATSANDRPVAAVIGAGGRGTGMAWKQFGKHADLAAICDADLRRAERSAATIEKQLGKRPEIYQDYRELLQRSDIDVVGNATPDHWHTKINVDACLAGKDVYAEKPLTFTINEGKLLRDVVRREGRILQVGTQQRSVQHFRTACELVRSGRIGKLRSVGVLLPFGARNRSGQFSTEPVPEELNWDLWQGQASEHPFCPQRLSFRRWHEYSAGIITDWGQHHFDIAHWGMGVDDSGPSSVDAKGYLFNVGKEDCFNNIDVFSAHLQYPNDVDLWCLTVRDDGYLDSLKEGYPSAEADEEIYAQVPDQIKSEKRNGVMFIGDRGRIFVNRGGLYGAAADELSNNPLPANSHLYVSDDHMGNLIECTKTRKTPICSVDIGHRSATPCHLVNMSMRLQRKLRWDAVKEVVVGDDEANAMLDRPKRAPYTLG
ncbi:MAG: Gfo/Idh/MocA family oxidoreductase [Planctomycetota bacterium]